MKADTRKRFILETAFEVYVGANLFAHSDSYVRINSHPQMPFNYMKWL